MATEISPIRHPAYVKPGFLFVILLLAGWPLQKILSLNPGQRFRRRDGLLFLICGMVLTSMLTCLLLDFYYDSVWTIETDRRLTETADHISRNFKAELNSAYDKLVAFISDRRLWILGPKGPHNLGVTASKPAMSPDGSQILFARDGRLWMMETLSGYEQQLVSVDGIAGHPAMSPDGRTLAFTVQQHGVHQIWWKPLPNGEAEPLTSANCNHDSPVWEGDSRRLIFTSDCGRGLGLPALYRSPAIAIGRQEPR
jgi:WD40-like Beta Propeller Repeat